MNTYIRATAWFNYADPFDTPDRDRNDLFHALAQLMLYEIEAQTTTTNLDRQELMTYIERTQTYQTLEEILQLLDRRRLARFEPFRASVLVTFYRIIDSGIHDKYLRLLPHDPILIDLLSINLRLKAQFEFVKDNYLDTEIDLAEAIPFFIRAFNTSDETDQQ